MRARDNVRGSGDTMALRGRSRLWLTVFLGIMTAIVPLSTDMYLPALPEVQADFGVSTSLIQMTLTMTTLGMALGQILLFASWRATFVLLTLIGVGLAAATLAYSETLAKEARSSNVTDSLKKFPILLKNRYFLGHCLVQCFVFGAFFCYLAGSSFIFQNIYSVSPQAYSLIFGAIGLGLLVTGVLPARLAGRVPDVRLLKYAVLVPLLGSILLLTEFYFTAPLLVIVLLLFLTVVPLSVMGAASFSLALSRQGKNAGSASALIGCSSMLLGACMMPVVGIVGDHTALPMAIIMVTLYALGALVFFSMIAPEHRAV